MESIKSVRQRQGMSLADVGDAAGLHRQAVARAERGGVDPRASTLLALAKAMQVPVCELFGKEGRHERARKH